jgi:hypothetical protein
VFGAPVLWSVQEIATYALTAHACFPVDTLRAVPASSATRWIALLLVGAAVAGAASAGAIAYRCWRSVQDESEGREHRALEVGEGRTRFMALSGVLLSAAFSFGILMHGVGLLFLPLCGGAGGAP